VYTTVHSRSPERGALKADCFGLPLLSPGDLNGAIPVNIFRQSRQRRADISIKMTQLTERYALKYAMDIFNVTNTASFDIPIDFNLLFCIQMKQLRLGIQVCVPDGRGLLRRSHFEPVLDALLSGCGACLSHRERIVFFLLLVVEHQPDSLHRLVLERAQPVDSSTSRD
jgi:hypothetical protein